ncbi:hypothetical protein CEXT_715231 [Caerostris extrusa]|uniref:Uncharacterized protein n=1 Tax=Caerostris extrusa TaxID=172846 RepID=A0AAV4WZ03_CAEEX|nr:hypothetical protein CEXT_715231 [Caerostris extrusa]
MNKKKKKSDIFILRVTDKDLRAVFSMPSLKMRSIIHRLDMETLGTSENSFEEIGGRQRCVRAAMSILTTGVVDVKHYPSHQDNRFGFLFYIFFIGFLLFIAQSGHDLTCLVMVLDLVH